QTVDGKGGDLEAPLVVEELFVPRQLLGTVVAAKAHHRGLATEQNCAADVRDGGAINCRHTLGNVNRRPDDAGVVDADRAREYLVPGVVSAHGRGFLEIQPLARRSVPPERGDLIR